MLYLSHPIYLFFLDLFAPRAKVRAPAPLFESTIFTRIKFTRYLHPMSLILFPSRRLRFGVLETFEGVRGSFQSQTGSGEELPRSGELRALRFDDM